jgi:hypothetical protein
VTVYVLIAIVRKQLQLTASLNELLQILILSVTLFEQTSLECALRSSQLHFSDDDAANQLILFAD